MHRNSAAARAIVEAVGRPGVTGRWLERQSQTGLLPPVGTPAEDVHRHVIALADFNPHGHDPDRVAIMLAARGFGCVRYPQALHRFFVSRLPIDPSGLNVSERAALVTPLSNIDPTSDEGAEVVEGSVEMLMQMRESVGPTPLIDMQRALYARIEENATRDPVMDPTSGVAETPQQTLRAVVTETRRALSGGHTVATESVSKVADVGMGSGANIDGVLAEAADMCSRGEQIAWDVMLTTNVPLDVLVAGAELARMVLAENEDILGGPERLDLLAGLTPHIGLIMMRAFSPTDDLTWLRTAPEEGDPKT